MPERSHKEGLEPRASKEIFQKFLEEGNFTLARGLKEELQGIDLTEEISMAVGISFQREDLLTAARIIQNFGQGIDFIPLIQKYAGRIMDQFYVYLEAVEILTIADFKRAFGPVLAEEMEKKVEEYLRDYREFNEILEVMEGEEQDFLALFEFAAVREDPIKQLYICRTLSLFPQILYPLLAKLGARGISLEPFLGKDGKRKQQIDELNKRFEDIGKSPLDTTKLSFNLEIEYLNKDEVLEKDTPITNNAGEIISLVRAIDIFNADIQKEMQKLAKNPAADYPIVGVYDSVHINIGLPSDKIRAALEDDIFPRTRIVKVLELCGLIYNSIGRFEYMVRRHPDRFSTDEASGGYRSKFQNRLWSFNFATPNAPFFSAIIRYVEKILAAYTGKGGQQAEEDAEKIETIIREEDAKNKASPERPRYSTVLDTLGGYDIGFSDPDLPGYPNAYLPGRAKILRRIMREVLAARIK